MGTVHFWPMADMSVPDPKRTFNVSNNSMNTLMEKEMRKLAESGNSVDVIGSLLNFNQRATGSPPVRPTN
jgi:hypothetical protein